MFNLRYSSWEGMPLVSSSELLDFGDCFGGQWVNQQLTLKNTGKATLEVLLSASGAELRFELLPDEDEPNTQEEEVSAGPSGSASPVSPSKESVIQSNYSIVTTEEDSQSPSDLDGHDTSSKSIVSSHPSGHIEPNSENKNLTCKLPPEETRTTNAILEELMLKPASEKTLVISYRPKLLPPGDEFNSGRLVDNQFQIILLHSKLENYSSDMTDNLTPVKPAKKTLVIDGRSRSCTSFLDVMNKKLNFGITNIGMQKSLSFFVSNFSDLPTQTELKYISKILSCPNGPITIAPRSTIEVKVDIFPGKVNPNYRKQIIVSNLNNPSNDNVVEIESIHKDNNRVAFHSLFYKILTATGSNYLDLDKVGINSPKICNFVIENISRSDLELELSTDKPDLLFFFKINEKLPADHPLKLHASNQNGNNSELLAVNHTGADLKETILETMEDQSRAYKNTTSFKNSGQASQVSHSQANLSKASRHDNQSTTYLDLAQGGNTKNNTKKISPGSSTNGTLNSEESKMIRTKAPIASRIPLRKFPISTQPSYTWSLSKKDDTGFLKTIPVSSIFAKLEEEARQPVRVFSTIAEEEEHVTKVIQQRRDLENYIKTRVIVPVKRVVILPRQKFHVIVLFAARGHLLPQIQGIPRMLNAKIFIKLHKFGRPSYFGTSTTALNSESDEIPVREILVQSLTCRSSMDLGQKNFNFGLVNKDVTCTRLILIRNLSEAPLCFMLRKSGSIASGDLYFQGSKYGVVPPFGKKEVSFTFNPSLPGTYLETVIVRNIQNPDDDQVLTYKAIVRKPTTFSVDISSFDFGPCYVNEVCSRECTITISNTHRLSRVLEVRVDPNEMDFGWCSGSVYFYVNSEHGETGQNILSVEVEQQIEVLEQKLKIAHRKGQEDKVKKIQSKLARLRSGESKDLDEDHANDNDEKAVDANSAILNHNERHTSKLKSHLASPSSPATSLPSKSAPAYGELGYVHRTAHSVQFTVPGSSRLSVSVWIRVCPIQGTVDSQGSSVLAIPKEMVSGQLLVHEHRNRDAYKKVMFQALVYHDFNAYQHGKASYSQETSESLGGSSVG